MPLSFFPDIPESNNIHPGYTPGEYYFAGSFWGSSSNATGTLTRNTIRYHPVSISENIIIDRLCLDVTTAVTSSTAKLAIYLPSTTTKGKPGNLLISTGWLDCSTAGIKEGIISATHLTPGTIYIAGLGGSVSPNIKISNSNIYTNFIGVSSPGSFADFWVSYSQAGSFADFPLQASNSLGGNRIAPIVKFRVKP